MALPVVRNSIRGSRRQAYPHQGSRTLPRPGLLLYLGRPNLEAADVPIGDDTEIGDDTIIRWMFLLPADADIRAATGWISGTGNIFYDAVGDPVAVLASEIAAWASINQWNVLFHLVSADTETGRLAIYDPSTVSLITLARAYKALRSAQNASGVIHTTPFIDQIGANTRTLYGLQYIHLAGDTDFTNADILGTETVISQPAGTAVITVAAGKLTIAAGDLWSFALSNGSTYEFGTILTATTGVVFDTSGNGRHLLFTVTDTAAVCIGGSREKGSEYLDTEGWSASIGDIYIDSTGSTVSPSGTTIPSLSNGIANCGFEPDPSQRVLTDIGPFPWPEWEQLSTPKWYVDSAATGTGTGLSWANAKTTITAAHTAASTGDIIEVSGGVSGKSYSADLTITKGVTIQGSTTEGHNGLVTQTGYIYYNNAGSGVIKLKNFKHTRAYVEFNRAATYYNGSVSESVDMDFGPWEPSLLTEVQGGSHSWTRCKFYRTYGKGISVSNLFMWPKTNPSNLLFDNCLLFNAGKVESLIAGSTLIIKKCLILGYGNSPFLDSFCDVGNSASTLVSVEDTTFLGVLPFKSGALSKINAKNVFWHKTPYITGIGGDVSTFDSANIAVKTNVITNTLPHFTRPRNTPIGDVILRYDDRNNMPVSIATAAVLNPEIKLTHAVDLHSRKSQTRPTALDIDRMRWLLSQGNEISSHSASHSKASSLNYITISATGTSPTLTISTVNSGDSTTWTGNLTVIINGVSLVLDLTDPLYDSLGVLVTALHGRALGNGVITATKTEVEHSNYIPSCALGSISGQAISSSYTMLLNDAAFVRFETIEAIADLETYINTGVDRNGSNSVSGMSISPPSIPYVCRTYAAPYGLGRSSVKTALISTGTILGANQSTGTVSSGDFLYKLAAVDIYNIPYLQDIGHGEDLFAMAVSAITTGFVSLPLWHGGTPTYGGSLANFKAMMMHFDCGKRTFAEVLSQFYGSSDWSITSGIVSFIGNADNYLRQGDYTLLPESPLKGVGSPIETYISGPLDFPGQAKLNISPISNPTDTTITTTHTYSLADSHQIRTALGWTWGVDHWAFTDDGVPRVITGATLLANGIGPKIWANADQVTILAG